MILVRYVVFIGLIPVQTSKCHESVSPTAVCIMIGDTRASYCRGNSAKVADMVNFYVKGKVSHKNVSLTAVRLF